MPLTFGRASSAGVILRSSIRGEEVGSDMRVGRAKMQRSGAASATSVVRPNMLRIYQQEREQEGIGTSTDAGFHWVLDSVACHLLEKSATGTTSSS